MLPHPSKFSRRPPEFALRFLYEDEQLPTRAIAAFYGVSHMGVKRWLRHYGIVARPPHRGIETTGLPKPTADDLRHMIDVEHLSYEAIGARYGVGRTAIPNWLDKHGIARPEPWVTRRKGAAANPPTEAELRERYERDGQPSRRIADEYGVSATMIAALCRSYGILRRRSGFNYGRRYSCRDGHEVRSVYEQRIDNWLFEHEIPHEYEPPLPFDRRCRADFRIGDAYIEIWGVSNRNARYKASRARKTALYHEHGIHLVELAPEAFAMRASGRWERKLATVFIQNSAQYRQGLLAESAAGQLQSSPS